MDGGQLIHRKRYPRNCGMIATGNHEYFGFAARSTTPKGKVRCEKRRVPGAASGGSVFGFVMRKVFFEGETQGFAGGNMEVANVVALIGSFVYEHTIFLFLTSGACQYRDCML